MRPQPVPRSPAAAPALTPAIAHELGGRVAGNPSQTAPNAGMLPRMTFRIGTQFTWGIGLIVAALVLGKKAEDPLPWAVGILGLVVVIGVALSAVAQENADKPSTIGQTPGASDTP